MSKISAEKKKDLILSAIVIILGIYVLQQAADYPVPPTRDLGPALLPELIGFSLIVCGAILILGSLRGGPAGGAGAKDAISYLKFLGVVALTLFYVFILPTLGYWGSTLIFLISLITLAIPEKKGPKTVLRASAVGIAATGAIYLAFGLVLKVPLP